MPRTKRIKIYKFSELSESAKTKAIEKCRERNYDYTPPYYDEIADSVKAVIELFNLKTGWNDNILRWNHIEDTILELSGVRLYKYLVNNYYNDLFTPRYIKTIGRELKCKQFICKTYKGNKGDMHTQIYSKNFVDNSCPLTGVCYDNDILQPVYDFLSKPTNNTFEDLISDIEHAISKVYRDTEEWINSDEFIKDEILANEYDFFVDGSISTL